MIIDSMIFIYSLLPVVQFKDKATKVLKKTESIIVPDSIRSEIANVVWQ